MKWTKWRQKEFIFEEAMMVGTGMYEALDLRLRRERGSKLPFGGVGASDSIERCTFFKNTDLSV